VTTSLYRYFDRSGLLLYIGISLDPFRRLQQHQFSPKDMRRVKRIEVEWFEDRESAGIAEKYVIDGGQPGGNIQCYGGGCDCLINYKATPAERDRWHRALKKEGKTLSEVCRKTLDRVAKRVEAKEPSDG